MNVDFAELKHKRKFFVYAGIIATAFGSLFYLLRTKTHFLGDGYTAPSSLATDHPAAAKAYRRAIQKGLDSAYVEQLTEEYPELRQSF